MSTEKPGGYYLPAPSSWPVKTCFALLCMALGAANWMHEESFGPYLLGFGFLILIYIAFGWFGTVVRENRAGLLADSQVDRSFRWAMCWFIFSEVMFFGAFFFALLFIRAFVIPMLGGTGVHVASHVLLWPNFHATWPLLINPNPSLFVGPQSVMDTWGVPALNTAILLTSGVTITIAHWSLLKDKRKTMLISQLATILLGVSFLIMQAMEYTEAYMHKGLTLGSGSYGTTFFMLTGFHGLHVTIGTIGLIVILYRMLRRDFNPHNHFAFEAISWYWHFVDVVWLLLFVLVYWL
ncbi:MAG: cytochrome c oxidase subunit 3 [Gammaproteobacteria bacterium]|nr:cytochrome c oxidase subunit 3 [Gammaproteobacteria bacterium]